MARNPSALILVLRYGVTGHGYEANPLECVDNVPGLKGVNLSTADKKLGFGVVELEPGSVRSGSTSSELGLIGSTFKLIGMLLESTI